MFCGQDGQWHSTNTRNEFEALGAVHLLGHGIFAFKVNAAGARTDLVIPDGDPTGADLYASGIVLTEWKIARKPSDSHAKFAEARRQAAAYASGPLASIELRSTRYAIVVTKELIDVPSDEEVGGILYRNVNISLNRKTPSVTSRRARK